MRNKTFLLFIFISAIHANGIAQQDKIADSLLNVLKTQKEDTNRVNTLNALSRRFSTKREFGPSDKYAKDAIALAEKLNFKKGLITAYSSLGFKNTYLGNYKEAIKNYRTSMKFGEETGNKSAVGNAYHRIGSIYFNQGGKDNTTEALKYYFASAKLYEEAGDKRLMAGAYYSIGNSNYSLSNYTEAIKAQKITLRLFKEIGDKPGIAGGHISLGNYYNVLDDYPEALENYLAALKISEEIGDKYSIGAAYNNIGIIYKAQGNYPEAKKNYLAGLKLQKEINNDWGIQGHYNYLGEIYQLEGNYTEAMNSHLAALKINEKIKSLYGYGNSYKGIGNTYFLQNNYHDALKNYQASLKAFQASLKAFKEMENKDGIAEIYKNIGKTYFKLNEYPEARQYFNDALSVAREIQVKEIIEECYQNLARLDSVSGNWEGAFINHKLFVFYRDSVVNEKNSNKITEMRMQFRFDKKEDSLKLQQAYTDQELMSQTLELNKQKSLKNYLLAGIVLLAILSFFVYKNYRTRQKLNLQTLRNKIASDLHDDVGSTLSSISIFSQMAQQQSKEVNPLLDTIGESSRKMLDAMADIVWTINPENDQFEKIILRMRSFAYELLGAKKIDFEFVADEYVTKINVPMEVRKNLYLIFKEATNNMVKYAAANRASFSIKGEKNNLIMHIKDNGKGFDTSQASEGNGLKNMKKRAGEIGGQLVIESWPGKGTEIQLRVAV